MGNIKMEDIGRDISLIPIKIIMRDQTPSTIRETHFNIIVNLDPTDGSYWVWVIKMDGRNVYYFDSFGVETPPLFLEEYVDIGSMVSMVWVRWGNTRIWWILLCCILFIHGLSYW